ncbi:hypothetical protein [Nocardioides nanhaiensis]|uniref:Phosphodiesterase n=1 Tax=Nocardioides nanhaiensis TaxID=1476871 RepID=A0ABP8VUE0_9ACTN
MEPDSGTGDDAPPRILPSPSGAGLAGLVDRAALAVGLALAAVVRVVAVVRASPRPLHPRGELRLARVERLGQYGPRPGWGVSWLDEPGEEAALVRLSRSIGLPRLLPDVAGLALRVWPGDGDDPGDLLFSSTGQGPVSRYLLRPTRHDDAPMTTLMPFRTVRGPLVLGARRTGPDELVVVAAAGLAGAWRPVARIVLGDPLAEESVDFDPVLNRVPGLGAYPWAVRLRRPAYAVARAGRGGDVDRPRDVGPGRHPEVVGPPRSVTPDDEPADQAGEDSSPGSDPPSSWAGPDLGPR